ncbi:SGNH/GDSL hydrolase family protein [Rhodotorula paludigena]|uniref:SGNH/GDSL hydrolase family protein n=1 Tax=Rhodotorula paludigena TaxID=86838 RepID=UPI00316E3BD5
MLSLARAVVAGAAVLAAVSPSAAKGVSLDGVETIFSFGDSYSTVGYSPKDGVHDLPLLGGTTAGGFNWVQYLAFSSALTNHSYYDLAQSGATVNSSVLKHEAASPLSFEEQVDLWEDFFVGDEAEVKWQPETALFTAFFGINDMGYTGLQHQNATEKIPQVVSSYENLISKLYEDGARKFLLLTMPSTFRAPYIRSFGPDMVKTFESNTASFLAQLKTAISDLAARYPDASLARFDVQPFLDPILDDPKAFNLTIGDSSCPAYWNTHDPERNSDTCEAALKDYVWLDDYHPTWSVHKLLAESIQEFLADESAQASALASFDAVATSSTAEASSTGSTDAIAPMERRGRHGANRRRRPLHGGSARARRMAWTPQLLAERAKMRRRWAGLA